jgi:TRAP-type C4-dicarboxylate transport system substrate-binding protein
LKKARLFVSKEDVDMLQWYNRNGFNAKPLAIGDIATQLKLPNGIIDTAPLTPYLGLMTQVFGSAKYMLDAHIAPLVGAVVVTSAAWNPLSAEDKAALTAAAQEMETRIRSQAPSQDAESIKAMTARGLVVTVPDARTMAEFRKAAADLAVTMRGGIVPDAIYDMAAQERDASRKKK